MSGWPGISTRHEHHRWLTEELLGADYASSRLDVPRAVETARDVLDREA